MPGYEKMLFRIPKEAMKLVNSGEAMISSGGIRLMDGTLKALAEPVKENALKVVVKTASKQAAETLLSKASEVAANPILGGISAISSLAGNVQCAFIQKGVNQANKKLDNLTDRVEDIFETVNNMDDKLDSLLINTDMIMKTMNNVQILSVASLAVGILNCTINVIGFYKTFQKLDDINSKLDNILSTILAEWKGRFISLKERAITLIEYYEETYFNYDDNYRSIELVETRRFLGDSYAFLNMLYDELKGKKTYSNNLLAMIYCLSVFHAKILKYYQIESFLKNGRIVNQFSDHIKLLKDISNDKKYLEFVRSSIFATTPEVSPLEKQQVYNLTKQIIPNELEICNNWMILADKYGGDSYEKFCSTLTKKIKDNYINNDYYLLDGMGNYYIEI